MLILHALGLLSGSRTLLLEKCIYHVSNIKVPPHLHTAVQYQALRTKYPELY